MDGIHSPKLSSPKLSCDSPSLASASVIDSTKLDSLPSLTAEATPSTASTSSSSSSSSPTEQLIAKLERDFEISQARNTHLQQCLTDARKACHDSEQLLLRLQWDPKDDFYAFKIPTKPGNSELKYLDKQELKMKSLIDQMRVMQRVLEETKSENEDLKSKIEELESDESNLQWQFSQRDMSSAGSTSNASTPNTGTPYEYSPVVGSLSKKQRVKSPLATQSSTPGASSSNWMRSPTASPTVTSTPSAEGKSPRWWLFRKLSPGNSPSFWRSSASTTGSNPDQFSLSGSASSPTISSTTRLPMQRGRSSLEIGATTPNLPNHDIRSPAISHKHNQAVALQA